MTDRERRNERRAERQWEGFLARAAEYGPPQPPRSRPSAPDTCPRCGETRGLGAADRFQVHLEDRTDSTFTSYDLGLCVACWEGLLDHLGIGDADPGSVRVRGSVGGEL